MKELDTFRKLLHAFSEGSISLAEAEELMPNRSKLVEFRRAVGEDISSYGDSTRRIKFILDTNAGVVHALALVEQLCNVINTIGGYISESAFGHRGQNISFFPSVVIPQGIFVERTGFFVPPIDRPFVLSDNITRRIATNYGTNPETEFLLRAFKERTAEASAGPSGDFMEYPFVRLGRPTSVDQRFFRVAQRVLLRREGSAVVHRLDEMPEVDIWSLRAAFTSQVGIGEFKEEAPEALRNYGEFSAAAWFLHYLKDLKHKELDPGITIFVTDDLGGKSHHRTSRKHKQRQGAGELMLLQACKQRQPETCLWFTLSDLVAFSQALDNWLDTTIDSFVQQLTFPEHDSFQIAICSSVHRSLSRHLEGLVTTPHFEKRDLPYKRHWRERVPMMREIVDVVMNPLAPQRVYHPKLYHPDAMTDQWKDTMQPVFAAAGYGKEFEVLSNGRSR